MACRSRLLSRARCRLVGRRYGILSARESGERIIQPATGSIPDWCGCRLAQVSGKNCPPQRRVVQRGEPAAVNRKGADFLRAALAARFWPGTDECRGLREVEAP